MNRPVTPKVGWDTILVEDDESDQPVGPVVVQQAGDEQPQQGESPTESQDVSPDEEKADAGAPEGQGTDLGADTQQLVKPITGPEGGDDPEVIGHAYATPEPIEKPETGEGKPPI